ncbi:ABC-2 family transporter protein [Hazenella sp. IB182357]|uniref:ABC-2 family transporter protein n=1 Tax=Polycladospora coralii TaxID=2771432 RepID=A0A926NDH2_9BACL|nr:ABC-2 family transporter protein [Polycladospora coralii]MBD1373795.1 ABC-2 family transporter protein [Polycladospora coralii]MBS7531553.1 ABC-2 family transporter protein [Polycladospora coralii]
MFQIRLFHEYFKQYMKTRLAYRWDFLAQFLTNFLFQAVNLVFILVVFGHTSDLNGWNQYEVIAIYGYFLIPWSIFSAFFNLWDFNEKYIIKGELDRVLTRPVHSLLQIIMETMTPESLIGVFTGVLVMGYGIYHLDLTWTLLDFFFLVLFSIGGVLVYGGIYTILTSISLYTDSKTDIQPIIFNVSTYGRYPINIYHRFIQIALTWVLPFAFVGFYPASYLLDKQEWFWYAMATPLVGIVYLGLGVFTWNQGIKRYRGAGN